MTAPTTFLPVQFDAPLITPAPDGLYAVTQWTDDQGPTRWLGGGIEVRPHNVGLDGSFGVWDAPWCAGPDDLGPEDVKKAGPVPTALDAFAPQVVWAAADSDDCGPVDPSAAEVIARARHTLDLHEHLAVERQFAARAKADAVAGGLVLVAGDVRGEIAALEKQLGTLGLGPTLWHASRFLLPYLVADNLVVVGADGLQRSPGGHQWVFGGGYAHDDALGDTFIVATTPTFGWRSPVQVRDTLEHQIPRYTAIAERSVVVGYEAVAAAARIG